MTTVTVPWRALKSATVSGMRSPCSSMRAMTKCPGRAARATSGAFTSQRKVVGPNCLRRVMRNTTPSRRPMVTEFRVRIRPNYSLCQNSLMARGYAMGAVKRLPLILVCAISLAQTADKYLLTQLPSGAWAKDAAPGLATIDNGATYTQLEALAKAHLA